MQHFSVLFIFLLVSITTFSQSVFTQSKDTLNDKMKHYMCMIKEANVYEIKTEKELQTISNNKSLARLFLDSAYIIAKKGEIDIMNAQLYIKQFNYLYEVAAKYSSKADSILKIAQAYKDTANFKNKIAEAFYLELAEDSKPVFDHNSSIINYYTVQLGAGNMQYSYFEKINDVEVITPSDGIKRFINGKFITKKEAIEFRQKARTLGYLDSFIRTVESLNY